MAWGIIVGYLLCRNQLVDMFSGHTLIRYIVKNCYIILYFIYAKQYFKITAIRVFINLSVCHTTVILNELALSYIVYVANQYQSQFYENPVLSIIIMTLLQGLEILTLYILYLINQKYSYVIEHKALFCMLVINCTTNILLFWRFDALYEQHPEAIFNLQTLGIIMYQVTSLIYFAYCLFFSQKKEQNLREIIVYNKNQLNMLNDIEERIGKSRRILHDINNHLATIQILAEQGRNEEIDCYVRNLLPEVKNARVPDITDSILAVMVYGKRMEAR